MTETNIFDEENWQEIMLKEIAKYPERTGRQRPEYEEMLDMDENEFRAWLIVKSKGHNQETTLSEMIQHEQKTNLYTRHSKDVDPITRVAAYDIFDPKKSEETVKHLRELYELTNEAEDQSDPIFTALFAKGVSDYATKNMERKVLQEYKTAAHNLHDFLSQMSDGALLDKTARDNHGELFNNLEKARSEWRKIIGQ